MLGQQATGAARVAHDGDLSGVLRIADQGDTNPVTLDPAINPSYNTNLPIELLFSGLVRLTPERKVVDDMAQTIDVSPDGRVYTFHLRPNLKFSDGTPVTSDDFVYSLTRSLGSARDPRFAGIRFLGQVDGALAYYLGRAKTVSGLKDVDPQTLQITLAFPVARSFFLGELSWTTGYVVERNVVEKNGPAWPTHNAGTGPFMIQSIRPSQGMTLVPNPYWYGGKVALKRVEIPFIVDTNAAYNAYQTNTVDVIGVGAAGFPARLYQQARQRPEFHEATGVITDIIDFSQRVPSPFANLHVRRAFSLAVDKETLARIKGGSVQPTDGFIIRGDPAFNPGFKGLHYDPAAAQKEMAAAGFPGGRRFPVVTLIYYIGSTDTVNTVQAMQLMWQQTLGVQVRLRPVQLFALFPLLLNRHFDIALSQSIAPYPDTHASFFGLLRSTGLYFNPTFEALIDRADALIGDDARRTQLYRQAEAYVAEQAPNIPLDVTKQAVLINARVHGLSATPYGVDAADWTRVTAQ